MLLNTMGKLKKFEDVDVFAALNGIMQQNTGFYQSDLDIDKQIITKAAASKDPADKTLLWISRPAGTHCFRERDVFLKDTAANATWHFHREQSRDRILAYAVEVTGIKDGTIRGNLYELDYARHYERVKETEQPADMVRLIYENGEREQPAEKYFNGSPDPQLGKFERFEALPNDPGALQDLLREEKRSREALTPGDLGEHTAELRDGLIEHEARRIVSGMKQLHTPNSPNKSHFMVEISPEFLRIAGTRDTDRLLSMLPYKSPSFSKVGELYGTYALIGKDENRDKDIRKVRPSIRAQLATDKAKTAPKRTAAKTKKHDLEV